ncbi:MAG: UDP-N-acetylglucosamine 2-epimerase, partial [Desulfobacterales bacterium]
DVLKRLDLNPGQYLVVSAHREENVDNDENFSDLLKTLNAISAKFEKQIIFSTHPRTRKKLEGHGDCPIDEAIRFLKPLGFLDYIKLQKNAFCVVSDSGTITEESSILGFPAVTIRQAHERPEGMDEGTLIMCGLRAERVLESIGIVTRQQTGNVRRFRLVRDYEPNNVSKKVLRIILSYTDYVNRTVWSRF